MRPGNGEILLILDKSREIVAIDEGRTRLPIDAFEDSTFDGLHDTEDFLAPGIPMAGNMHSLGEYSSDRVRLDVPNFEITAEKLSGVKAAAEACLTIKGMRGALLKITGVKRAASNIVRVISEKYETIPKQA